MFVLESLNFIQSLSDCFGDLARPDASPSPLWPTCPVIRKSIAHSEPVGHGLTHAGQLSVTGPCEQRLSPLSHFLYLIGEMKNPSSIHAPVCNIYPFYLNVVTNVTNRCTQSRNQCNALLEGNKFWKSFSQYLFFCFTKDPTFFPEGSCCAAVSLQTRKVLWELSHLSAIYFIFFAVMIVSVFF